MTAHDEAVKAAAEALLLALGYHGEHVSAFEHQALIAVAAAAPILLAAERQHHGRHACCAVAERHRAEGAAAERQRIAAAIRAEAQRLPRDYFTETALLHAARIAEAGP